MGFGFVVARFGLFLRELELSGHGSTPRSPHISLWFGTALVLMGVVVNLLAAFQHARLVLRLQNSTWTGGPSRSGMAVAIALAGCGLLVTGYLLMAR